MIFLFWGIFFCSGAVKAQVHGEIIVCLKSGNAKALSDYFNQNVELVVLDNDNVYSKAQAQQIVGNFFSSYSPEQFTVIHQGGRQDAKYVIGTLKTRNGQFRVYFLLKENEDRSYIHQLRIEKQE